MTPLSSPSWSQFFEEFRCRSCGGEEVYRSRPRGFFERYVLPLLFLQTVRCERCYHRTYVWRTIPAIEHTRPQAKDPASQPPDSAGPDGRVA